MRVELKFGLAINDCVACERTAVLCVRFALLKQQLMFVLCVLESVVVFDHPTNGKGKHFLVNMA